MWCPETGWLTVPRHLSGAGPGERVEGDEADRFPLGRRVLITEDNWLIASELEAELQDAGYIVTGVAVSADEAIALCQEGAPDFVLMDIRLLGKKDGVEAAIEIRRAFDVPSVFISAHDDPAMRERAAAAQPLGWISKPVVASRVPELLALLRSTRS